MHLLRQPEPPLPLVIAAQMRKVRTRRLTPHEQRELIESLEVRVRYFRKEAFIERKDSHHVGDHA